MKTSLKSNILAAIVTVTLFCAAQAALATAPSATTQAATSITSTSAQLNGYVNPNGLTTTVYWQYGLTTSYGSATTSGNVGTTVENIGTVVSGLTVNTTYHFRFVAYNSSGTTYGSDLTFTTSASAPTATTQAANSVTSTSAQLNGYVNPNGASTTVYWQYGLTSSYGYTTTSGNVGTTVENIGTTVSSLTPNTIYHFRFVAYNSGGTSYGGDLTFTTQASAPTATTEAATSVTSTAAQLNGYVNPNGASTTVYWQYGLTTSYGSTTTSGNVGTTVENIGSTVSSLTPNTTYHFRFVAYNSGGTTYGGDLTFITTGGAPTATTEAATSVTSTSAQLNGYVNPNGLSTTVYWQYGLTTSYGGTTTSGNVGTTVENIGTTISGLTPNTTYHFRFVAYNSSGTTYGSDLTFGAPPNAPTATTEAATSVTSTSAQLNGYVNPNNTSTTVYWQYGLTTSYGSTTVSGNVGTTVEDIGTTVSSLTPNTTYHFRFVAYSSGGTNYGSDLTFNTSSSAPIATTEAATSVTSTSAQLNGYINPNGLSATVYWQYGLTTSYGSTTISGNVGTIVENIGTTVSSLSPNTIYHFRFVASTSGVTTYGSDLTFTTSGTGSPTVVTLDATSVTTSTAQLNGTINPNGFSTTAHFEYGLTTAYGNNGASGNFGTMSQNIGYTVSGLAPNTTYHFRLDASNTAGPSYGVDKTLTTLPTTTTAQNAWVSGTGGVGLRLRDAPSLSGNILLVMPEGAEVTLLSGTQSADGYLWRNVTYDSQTGWADSEYLVFSPSGTPTPPAAPSNLRQLQSDGISPIAAGGTATSSSVILAATPGASSSQQFSVQFEIRPAGTAFSSPTITSAVVQGGSAAQVTVNNLLNQGYHWRARVLDGSGLTSDWVSFSGNASDFTVAAPNVPLALFTWSPSQIFSGNTVQFTANAASTPGLTFSWNFGNGDTGTGGTPSELFSQVGQFTVKLTITDSQGNQTANSQTISVASPVLVDAINKLAQNTENLLFQLKPEAINCANAADQFKPAVDAATANIATEGAFQALFLGSDLADDLDLVKSTLGQQIFAGTVDQALQGAANLAVGKLYSENSQSCYQLFIPNISAYILQESNSIEQLRQQAITAAASIDPTTASALAQNLQARYAGNTVISGDYLSKSLLPTTFAQIQQDDEDSWTYLVGENLFDASVGLGLTASGYGVTGALGIMLTVSEHGAQGSLDILNTLAEQSTDAQMLGLCFDVLGQANFSARLMTENVETGLNDVISVQASATPAGQMTIQHIAQGQLSSFGYTPRWLTENAYANITVQNTGTVGANYRVEAIYAKSFTTVSLFPFWTDGIGQRNYDIDVVSTADPVYLGPGQQAQIPIYYKTPEGGQLPDGDITYNLTATTTDGTYFEQMQLGHFGTTYEDTNGNVIAQSDLPVGLLDTQKPVSASLSQYGNSTICTLTINVNNPYESPVLMDVAQTLPAGTTVIDADGGTTNGHQLLWEANLQPAGSTVLQVTLELPTAFTNQPLPDTTASVYDSVNAAWINLDATPSFIQVTNVPAPQLQPMGLNNGGFNLSLQTFVPGAYRIDATKDFASWIPLVTSTNVQGTINFKDTGAQTNAYQFYRAAKIQ